MEEIINNPYQLYMYSYPHKTAYRPFERVRSLEEVWRGVQLDNASLYMHIPFCLYRCAFCNLFTVIQKDEETVELYLKQLEREARAVSAVMKHANFSSFYIGGGTPLYLTPKQLANMFSIAEKYFSVKPSEVFTAIEASPETVTMEKLALLKEMDVARLSIGIQSTQPNELLEVGRKRNIENLYSVLEDIQKKQFNVFNIDLIYGIPSQTSASFLKSIDDILQFEPNEIFLYPLYIREQTALYRKKENYEDTRLALYEVGRDKLLSEGFTQHSMRRFVKTTVHDSESSCGDERLVGLGCGARSYTGKFHYSSEYGVSQKRCGNILEAYLQKKDFLDVTYGLHLTEDEKKRRYVIKNTLFQTGLCKKEYELKFRANVITDFPVLQALINDGYFESAENEIWITEKGLKYSDAIGMLFVSENIKENMEEYEMQ